MSLPVVLLPSLGRGASDFDRLAADLRAAGFEVLALDPPPDLPLEVTLHDLADRVREALDARGWQQVHLVGHAFGQRVARCVVADHPDRVATLTMLASGGLVPMDPEIAFSLASCFDTGLSAAEHLRHVRRVFFAEGNDATVWADGWLPDIATKQTRSVHATEPGEWNTAAARRVPVVQGLQDACAVPENGRRFVAKHPGVATLVEIDGAGHALLPERPDEVSAALIGFLQADVSSQ